MSSTTLRPGHQVGPYTLIEPLGAGGMAQVYVAKRAGARDVCVLKLLHLALEQQGEAARRFQREAHIASQLDHPAIARVLDAGWADERFYIAMPLIEGVTVERLVEEAKARGATLPFEVSLSVALQALEALEYAHGLTDPEGAPLGLVHRDLSPRNLMLTFEGRLQIIDFGVAKGKVDEFRTASGVLMGTPFYMSPEQAEARRVDARSDLYTLAAVLFEMLTGARLAQGKGRVGIILSVVKDPAPRPTALNRHVPEALDEVLLKALEKDPDARYPTAGALADALRSAAGPLATLEQDRVAHFAQALLPEALEEARARKSPVMPSPLSAPGGADARTRTAAHVGADLAVAPLPLDPVEIERLPTRTAQPPPREPSDVATTAHTPPPPARPGWLGLGALAVLVGLGAALVTISLPPPPAAEAPVPKPAAAPPPPVRVAPRAEAPSAAAPVRAAAPRPEPAAALPDRARVVRPAPPPPAASPAPAPKSEAGPRAALTRRFEAVRASRDRRAAVALAAELKRQARGLPAEEAAAVASEVDRVYRTANVETMIEALEAALGVFPE